MRGADLQRPAREPTGSGLVRRKEPAHDRGQSGAAEREADRIAQAVLCAPSCSGARAEERRVAPGATPRRQSFGVAADSPAGPISVAEREGHAPPEALSSDAARILASGGQPLAAAQRRHFEARFGWDFSRVRIHADGQAARAVDSFGAWAVTRGSHVAFGTAAEGLETAAGRRLLAHELVHVIQHGAAEPLQRTSECVPRHTGDTSPALRPPLSGAGLSPKVKVTETMWRNRLRIQLARYRLALESPDIAVRRWSLNEAVKETNAHLGVAPGLFEPPQEMTDKVEGRTRREPRRKGQLDEAIGTNYVDAFDSWSYDVNRDIVKEGGGEWAGASPLLTLHFGGMSVDVDMREIRETTLTGEEIKAAFENMTTRNGIRFPGVISPSTAMHVVDAMQGARQQRDEAFAFTNSLALMGVSAFFMTWPGLIQPGPGTPLGPTPSLGGKSVGAWTGRAARQSRIRAARATVAGKEALEAALGAERYAKLVEEATALRAANPELAELTLDEIVALRAYTGESWPAMNAALRGAAEAGADVQPVIANATMGLRKLPSFSGSVTRTEARIVSEAKEFYKVGETVTLGAFTSTTKGAAVAQREGNVALMITATGRNGKDISKLAVHAEEEVLFLPGATFIVESVTESGSALIVVLKEL